MSTTSSLKETKKYAYIDALRGIAIIGVILAHTSGFISQHTAHTGSILFKITSNALLFGQLGVPLFFIASAVTLSMSMDIRKHNSGWLSYFYLRRFFRIAPMYYLGIFIYFFWSGVENWWNFGSFTIAKQYTLFGVISNVLFIHGLIPQYNNVIVPGGWSIGTEMLFYTIFPIIYFTFTKVKFKKLFLTVSLLILFLINFWIYIATNHYQILNDGFWYFNIVNQLCVFMLGIYLYVEEIKVKNISHGKHNIILLLGATFIFLLIDALLWGGQTPVRYFSKAFFAGLAFSFFALALSRLEVSFPRILIEIGKRSFSIYILHFLFVDIIGVISLKITSNFPLSLLVADPLIILFVTFYLAGITYRWIEKPGLALSGVLWERLKVKNREDISAPHAVRTLN